MKRISFLITILYLISFTNFAKAESNESLKKYLEKKDIEEGSTQIYLLNRCSAIYAYASAIILKTDVLTSKGFIEKANNLLFKSVELMIIDQQQKLEDAQKQAEDKRKKIFEKYVFDGKKNWDKNKSHFKGSYIAEDMSICSKLVDDK
jgi:hypothetical protein|tara:strand:- start:266 stop:709 length:444 start_codon:yes stop_codon:yes gene_type:complete